MEEEEELVLEELLEEESGLEEEDFRVRFLPRYSVNQQPHLANGRRRLSRNL